MEISRQVVREATELTAQFSAEQLELQLGHLCNNRCVFCTSGQASELGIARQIAVEPVIAALDQAASRGVRKVTFLGGEPTSQKSFLPALTHAVELGFSEIVIFTNGVTSSNRTFIDRIVAMGRFTWRFSIQGGTEEAHDAVTKVPGSFRRIIAGLTYLKELGQRVTANMCVNELSYRSLPHYPELVREYNIRDFHVDMVRPAQSGQRTDEYLQSILPRFSAMVPYLREMLEEFERLDPGYDVNVGNFPFCLLPEWSHKIHHGGQQTTLNMPDGDADGVLRSADKYQSQWSDMVYGPQCDTCALRSECRGVPRKYQQFYGFDELRPLTTRYLKSVSADDGRVFVRIADELLAAAYVAEPPNPWRRALLTRRSRDGFVEIVYDDGSGALAAVIFSRPGRDQGGQRLWETPHYRVSLKADAGSAHLRTLMIWLHSLLRIPVQSRIAACLQRIQNTVLMDGWRYTGFDADVESLAVTALLQTNSGERLNVTMTPDAGRDAQVRITFDASGERDSAPPRALVEQLAATLGA